MAKADTYEWEGGGTFLEGECDIPDCHNRPNWRYFYYPTYMNGDAECLASLCNEHKEWKKWTTTKKIISEYEKLNGTK